MISAEHRRILDQAGIEVVRAVYAKTLAVRLLPRDYNDPVQFSGGQVPLGEVDEWIANYSQRQAAQGRQALFRGNLSIVIAVASLVVAILALATRH